MKFHCYQDVPCRLYLRVCGETFRRNDPVVEFYHWRFIIRFICNPQSLQQYLREVLMRIGQKLLL